MLKHKHINRAIAVSMAATLLGSNFALAQTKKLPAKSPAKSKAAAEKPAPAPVLGLENYLEQVANQNQAYQSASVTENAATLRSEEWKLITRPKLFATAQRFDDQREVNSPTFQGNQTTVNTYSLGFEQQTNFGLSGRLYYNYNDTTITGADPMFLPNPNFYTTGPVLELTQSFGRNGFGREIRATQEAQAASALASRYSASFRQTAIGADAESAYWSLALSRELVESVKENLTRSERIRDWNAQRVRTQLADRSDLLQAEAAVLARQLELKNAMDEERNAARSFNTMRGLDSDVVQEQLVGITQAGIRDLKIPERAQFRDDVKAAEQQKEAAEANAQLSIERNRPTVDVFANLGLNGRDPTSGEAVSESFSTSHPNTTVGVRVNVPLDLSLLKKSRDAYSQEATAADLTYQRTVFEQERLWSSLTQRFDESRERLKLAVEIEKAQKQKLDHERERQRRGRSTTYQVILFEQDFANAQLARIRTQAEVLNIHAQLKTFRGGDQ